MHISEHYTVIEKKARYYTLGNFTNKTEHVIVVCHGYAQLAKYFIQKFQPIVNEKTVIIAPEGLSKFYWNGMSGRVVASWMTKEDRLVEIDDYVNYLDSVMLQVKYKLSTKPKCTVLGFSQGTATVCRWLSQGMFKANELILWAGAFPGDIDYFQNKELFNQMDVKVIVGNQDEYITEEGLKKQMEEIKSKGVKFNLHRFEGNHDIEANMLKKLFNFPLDRGLRGV